MLQSVSSIYFKVESTSYGAPSPEIPQSENEGKQRAKNIEDGDSLLFIFAVSRQSFFEWNSFAKGLKFWYKQTTGEEWAVSVA